jgi:hypothetical protein
VADRRRDDFPNNFVGDLVKTDRGWVVVPPTCWPLWPRLRGAGLVGQLSVVHLQRPAYGVALLVRQIDLRAPARARLPAGDIGPVSMWEDQQRQPPA